MAKRFFYVCAGLFLLAMTYHLGAKSAGAQAGGEVIGVSSHFYSAGLASEYVVATSSGDVYRLQTGGSWQFLGNALGGGPTPVTTESWGAVKDKYRK